MYYPMYYMFDPTYVLILIGVVISLAASAKLRGTYQRYAGVRSRCGMTGEEAARQLLRSQGIYDVTIRRVRGNLTDHYDPRTKTVNLSDSVYGSPSIAAFGVAAHECGHAMQDAQGYAPLRFRSALVPAANFGAQLSWPLIIIGLLLGGSSLVSLGILLFSLAVLFQLVTLPVEYNASQRALAWLQSSHTLEGAQLGQAKEALSWAARTYLVAALSAVASLLYYVLMILGRRD